MQQEHSILFKSKVNDYAAVAVEGESVLQAGLRQSVPLSYHCASGSCGSCKARLVQGALNVYTGADFIQVSHPVGQTSVGPEVHLCQSHAVTDCIFEASCDDKAPAELPTPKHYVALLKDVQSLGSGLHRLLVEFDDAVRFLPGQYVMLDAKAGGRARAYSVANFEQNSRQLEFILSCNPNGAVSPLLCDANSIGRELRGYGPLGKAYVLPKPDKELVMLVGGSGVSVALSALQWAISTQYTQHRRLTIFWGVRDTSPVDLIRVFNRCVATHPNIQVAICSDVAPSAQDSVQFPHVDFFEGYPADHIVNDASISWEDKEVYISGPPPMVDYTVRQLMINTEIDLADVKCDSFV
ncbi:FAD-binding oxidoreductase [Allopusillimonas ginsengisoli]|uniref:FAD-binding oxidoreductase n=1 Tax=Allopusillimonas ginsengisoli TaxID=453575 RepID=UPI0010206F9F|nr:FAD-binding oxidoreductase [Allopusillimonas ginsengisoli]TEA79936.1 2Fe-2S iron-sulfur cluster binding domain-containing protein [Allopusillimonas ginsengisoli]